MYRICVIGDIMLDHYVNCASDRMSPEAPVPVLNPKSDFFRLGGAANVAANISRLGAEVILIGATGNDNENQKIIEELNNFSVNYINISNDYETICKSRYLVGNHQIMRVDKETKFQNEIDSATKEIILSQILASDLIVMAPSVVA